MDMATKMRGFGVQSPKQSGFFPGHFSTISHDFSENDPFVFGSWNGRIHSCSSDHEDYHPFTASRGLNTNQRRKERGDLSFLGGGLVWRVVFRSGDHEIDFQMLSVCGEIC